MSNSDPNARPRPGPWPPAPESAAMPPSSWAKRTGFRPRFSGETNASDSGQISLPPRLTREPDAQPDLESGRAKPVPVSNGEPATEKVEKDQTPTDKDQRVKKRRDSDGGTKGTGHGANGKAPLGPPDPRSQPRRVSRGGDEVVDVLPQSVVDDDVVGRHSHMKYELRDTPGLGEHFST